MGWGHDSNEQAVCLLSLKEPMIHSMGLERPICTSLHAESGSARPIIFLRVSISYLHLGFFEAFLRTPSSCIGALVFENSAV